MYSGSRTGLRVDELLAIDHLNKLLAPRYRYVAVDDGICYEKTRVHEHHDFCFE